MLFSPLQSAQSQPKEQKQNKSMTEDDVKKKGKMHEAFIVVIIPWWSSKSTMFAKKKKKAQKMHKERWEICYLEWPRGLKMAAKFLKKKSLHQGSPATAATVTEKEDHHRRSLSFVTWNQIQLIQATTNSLLVHPGEKPVKKRKKLSLFTPKA